MYHVLNRANARMRIFDKPKDYEAFERILDEAVRRVKMRLLAYCVMPNHWHLVLWPREDGDLSTFRRLADADAHPTLARPSAFGGSGHVYQGRFKSFLVESDEHLWTVCRYVERNALRAGLCVGPRSGDGRVFGVGHAESAECQQCLSSGRSPCRRTGCERVNSRGKPTRVGGVASMREPRSTLLGRSVGGSIARSVRSGFSLPSPRPSARNPKQWFLTPFPG